jgi:predicted nuclease of predicted toxin-antitoxin system
VKIKFQADADLNENIFNGVLRREPRIDFRTAPSTGLRGMTDTEVLALAASEGRILVSHDRRTLPRSFVEFIRGRTSPGLFIISQNMDLLAAIEGLLLV